MDKPHNSPQASLQAAEQSPVEKSHGQQPRSRAPQRRNRANNSNKPKVAEKERFKLWLALPSEFREPGSQEEFAKLYGVNPVTLSEWKQQSEFMDEVIALAKKFAREATVEVLQAMRRSATSLMPGSHSDRKLWLEYFENFAERQEHTGKDGAPLPPLTIIRAPSNDRRKKTPPPPASG